MKMKTRLQKVIVLLLMLSMLEVFRYNSATNRIRVTNRMLDEEPEITDYWR